MCYNVTEKNHEIYVLKTVKMAKKEVLFINYK